MTRMWGGGFSTVETGGKEVSVGHLTISELLGIEGKKRQTQPITLSTLNDRKSVFAHSQENTAS